MATGCHFATDGMNGRRTTTIEGADTTLDWQSRPSRSSTGEGRSAQRVLVYDNEGYFMGAAMAQMLAGEGKQVTLVTPPPTSRPTCTSRSRPEIHRDLHRLGVEIRTDTCSKIEPGVVPRRPTRGIPRTGDIGGRQRRARAPSATPTTSSTASCGPTRPRLEREGIEVAVRDRRRRRAAA